MAKIVTLDLAAIDFDSAVDEVDILVPKYLEALETLDAALTVEDVGRSLQGVSVYWERLALLFRQIAPLEVSVPFEDIIRSTLQTELTVLERVYLRINLRLQLSESEWSDELFNVASDVLARLDALLIALGFDETHPDRAFVLRVQRENEDKLRIWLMRRHKVTQDD